MQIFLGDVQEFESVEHNILKVVNTLLSWSRLQNSESGGRTE